jgi:hypothetical protein
LSRVIIGGPDNYIRPKREWVPPVMPAKEKSLFAVVTCLFQPSMYILNIPFTRVYKAIVKWQDAIVAG